MSVFEWISQEIQLQFSKPTLESISWKLKNDTQSIQINKGLLAAVSPLIRDVLKIEGITEIEIITPEFDIETVLNLSKLLHFGQINDDHLTLKHIENVKKLAKHLDIVMDLDEEEVIVNDDHEILMDNEEMNIPENPAENLLTYHCTVEGCTSHFFTHVALKKHVESIHQCPAFLCQICQKRFSHQSSLRQHLSSHTMSKNFLCDFCGKGFRTKELCSSHRLKHGDRKLTCDICGAKFKQRNVLHQHKTVKHGTKKFDCLSCGKGFATKQNLEAHQRIHSGATPYACQLCFMSFKRVHHFKKHLATLKHLEQVSQCVQQGQAVPQDLDPALVLGLENANELAKQSCCDICPKNAEQRVTKFSSSYHFHKHIQSRSHMERILQCSQNGQAVGAHLIPSNFQVQPSENDVFLL